MLDGTFFKVALIGANLNRIMIPTPSASYAANMGAHLVFHLTQPGGTVATLDFETGGVAEYRPGWASQPDIKAVLDSETMIHMTIMPDKDIAYRIEHL